MFSFEFDDNKSAANKIKHGIDFNEARELWDDVFLIQISAREMPAEERYFVIGMINEKHYTAVITYREANIRIISVRRAREKEIDLYDDRRLRQEI